MRPLFSKTISPSLSPNSSWKDVWIALSYFLLPWKWLKWNIGRNVERLERQLKEYLGVNHVIAFESGRGSEYAIFQALGIGEGDEVIMQSFTCIVVANEILWSGAKPVYCDIDRNTYNMDPKKLEALITPKTKAIVLQHTFGKPGPIDEVLKIAAEHNLKVVEDCAHSLGSIYKNKQLGIFGDAAFYSLGRDKVISGVHGGFAVTNDDELAKKLREMQSEVPYPKRMRTFQHLMHPIAFSVILPLYNRFHIGKIMLILLQKMGLISKVFVKGEKQAKEPEHKVMKLSNALANLALYQFSKLEKFNDHRKKIAKIYAHELNDIEELALPTIDERDNCYRYSILSDKRKEISLEAKKHGFLLGDWYDPSIAPKGTNAAAVEYDEKQCPVATEVSGKVINLPTHPKITVKDAKQLVDIISNVVA